MSSREVIIWHKREKVSKSGEAKKQNKNSIDSLMSAWLRRKCEYIDNIFDKTITDSFQPLKEQLDRWLNERTLPLFREDNKAKFCCVKAEIDNPGKFFDTESSIGSFTCEITQSACTDQYSLLFALKQQLTGILPISRRKRFPQNTIQSMCNFILNNYSAPAFPIIVINRAHTWSNQTLTRALQTLSDLPVTVMLITPMCQALRFTSSTARLGLGTVHAKSFFGPDTQDITLSILAKLAGVHEPIEAPCLSAEMTAEFRRIIIADGITHVELRNMMKFCCWMHVRSYPNIILLNNKENQSDADHVLIVDECRRRHLTFDINLLNKQYNERAFTKHLWFAKICALFDLASNEYTQAFLKSALRLYIKCVNNKKPLSDVDLLQALDCYSQTCDDKIATLHCHLRQIYQAFDAQLETEAIVEIRNRLSQFIARLTTMKENQQELETKYVNNRKMTESKKGSASIEKKKTRHQMMAEIKEQIKSNKMTDLFQPLLRDLARFIYRTSIQLTEKTDNSPFFEIQMHESLLLLLTQPSQETYARALLQPDKHAEHIRSLAAFLSGNIRKSPPISHDSTQLKLSKTLHFINSLSEECGSKVSIHQLLAYVYPNEEKSEMNRTRLLCDLAYLIEIGVIKTKVKHPYDIVQKLQHLDLALV